MSVNVQNTAAEPFQCPVCLLEPGTDESPDTGVTTTSCGHDFGNECLARWLTTANTCPMCRRELGPPRLPQVSAEELEDLELAYLVDQALELHRHVFSAWAHHMGMGGAVPNVLDYESIYEWAAEFLPALQTWQSLHDVSMLRTTLEVALAGRVEWDGDGDNDQRGLQLLNDLVREVRHLLPAEGPPSTDVDDPYHEQILRMHSFAANYGHHLLLHVTEEQPLDAQTLHRMQSVLHCAVFGIESAEMDVDRSATREFREHLVVHAFPPGILDMTWSNLVRWLLHNLEPLGAPEVS